MRTNLAVANTDIKSRAFRTSEDGYFVFTSYNFY